MIYKYVGNIFTHDGQTTVENFGKEIIGSASALQAVDNLAVYVGYHGDTGGDFDRNFSTGEKAETEKMGKFFTKAKLIWIQDSGMKPDDIKDAVNKGGVFFTWCDSDKKVKKVMGTDMPKRI